MNQWNVELYRNKHSYVWQYGSKLLEILDPKPGEHILDLGCGTGELTAEIAATEARVIGLDTADSAIAQCRQEYPQKVNFKRGVCSLKITYINNYKLFEALVFQCREADLNCRHEDFQSSALPPELSWLAFYCA